ncbi:unnamed protein product, partial [Adineta steineri]
MQCRPTMCVYTFSQRFDFINAIVTVIGLAGGLSVVLRILVPPAVALIRRKKLPGVFAAINDEAPLGRMHHYWETVCALLVRTVNWARQLNWFEKAGIVDDDSIRRDQIITTRLYIVLYCASIFGVLLITTVPQQKVSFIVDNPSLTAYEQLQADQSTLICSCSNLAIPYAEFISLTQPTLHQ